jgi:hypothetical protein
MSLKIMVFNVVRVVRVEPRTQLNGKFSDQLVHIEFGGSTAKVYDPEVIAPRYASGELHEVKLVLKDSSIEKSNSRALGISGNRYYGKIVSVIQRAGLFDHLLDINGLRVHMLKHEMFPVGEHLSIKGMLNLDDIQLPNPNAWDTV